MPRRSWSDLSIRLAWSRSISALSRTAAQCNSSAALYPLWNCTSSAGSFAKLNLSQISPSMEAWPRSDPASHKIGETPMSTEQNVQTVKDFFAAIGRGDREALLALVAEDI